MSDRGIPETRQSMSDSTQNPPPSEEPSQYPPPPPPGEGSYQPAPPPSAQPMGAPAGVGQPADLLNRFLARLIDYVLLAVVNVIFVSIIIAGVIMGSSGGGFGMGTGGSFLANAVTSVLSAAIALGYFAFMESSRGQTVGKMLLKLETRGPDGGRPTMEQAIKRNAFTAIGVIGLIPVLGWLLSPVLSIIAVVMIAVTINNNTVTRKGWHDDFAGGTSVVKIG